MDRKIRERQLLTALCVLGVITLLAQLVVDVTAPPSLDQVESRPGKTDGVSAPYGKQLFTPAGDYMAQTAANNGAPTQVFARMNLDGTRVEMDLVETMRSSLEAAELGNTVSMQAICMSRFIAANGLQHAIDAISLAKLRGDAEDLEMATAISNQYQQVLAMVTQEEAIKYLNEAIALGNKSASEYKMQQGPNLCAAINGSE